VLEQVDTKHVAHDLLLSVVL